ncbi:glycosyltransferase, group 2 family protein [[Clostridium] scindens ATCC 35704]|uniref:Putative glycosyltransferase EpsJ n=1 Tax=Clostridium scindens (strain ATCC 35704 / DSM 5676 / VPI 13733 / 19) TaxID=411468 RepID=B0NG28_CLOS5|nr:glycosyltransferase family A protein [[Clostridium] scindens]EDS06482.1 glycosyltransferase, group 2 family protein [[Clostridium] scindens ATCC 35704]QBF76219.1 putative glycosyltransferase EpsJ [[Clostridium] scindens ATCC 35704]QRO35986.1 glycosyltransferase family 2 protein [[Clostridium] scindens]WPB35371.1 hypothetical protein PBLEJBOC_00011 [[Clostridium] scindens]BDF17153.1 glycosyl transferase [[Clostridium] scindens]
MKGDNHTFVICAYKESPFLEECIKSLLKQTVKSKIVMITSTPNEFIRHIADKYSLPVYYNSQGGITQDWNFAYSVANTDYVTITHQDDIYYCRFVERVLEKVKEANEPIITFTNYLEIREGQEVRKNKLLTVKRLMLVPLRFRLLQKRKIVRRMILAFGCPICCPSVTICKNKVKKPPFQVGFRSDEDWQAWERLSHMNGEFIYDAQILMGHRIHSGSETTDILKNNERTREDYIMFRKFWPHFIAKRLAKIYSMSEKSNEL